MAGLSSAAHEVQQDQPVGSQLQVVQAGVPEVHSPAR